ncbi:MAG: DUF4918 family protein [Spirochaetales bacterium]|nr:DUF4918 family protein [Spirochaetales bacterium]
MDSDTFGSRYLSFIYNTGIPSPLPDQTDILDPYDGDEVRRVVSLFYSKYYSDNNRRIFLIGINPGRIGCGVTGINFTDAAALQEDCGISSTLPTTRELSARFIYEMIRHCGGTDLFFSRFFLTALSPLGFTHNGKNRNYYDTPDLMNALRPWLIETFSRQIELGADRRIAFSLGQGKNYKILQELNTAHGFFEEIRPLPHPRWVMQYRSREKESFLDLYKETLEAACHPAEYDTKREDS